MDKPQIGLRWLSLAADLAQEFAADSGDEDALAGPRIGVVRCHRIPCVLGQGQTSRRPAARIAAHKPGLMHEQGPDGLPETPA